MAKMIQKRNFGSFAMDSVLGLSWAAMKLDIALSKILPLIYTDEWFDDGLPEE